MTFEVPFTSSLQRVEKDWIDYNGHLNMAFYNVIFDRNIDQALELLGLGIDYLNQNNASYFTLEAHVTYLQELKLDAPLRVTLQLLDYDEKRLHCFQEIYHAEDNFLAATSENISLHVDMAIKKSAPFPQNILTRIESMHTAHRVLERKPQVGHVIGIPKKSA
ncbi:MAG: thioesterase family protein [Rhizobiales bacterium]|nr:thioesterase family protein [Hyphomicrobiales bacterium]